MYLGQSCRFFWDSGNIFEGQWGVMGFMESGFVQLLQINCSPWSAIFL